MTWEQSWSDVLFLHYAVSPGAVEPHLPRGVELDTFDGDAWISLVFFRLTLRPAGWFYVPGFSSLRELNVRTYVTCDGLPGIIFLRMFADNRLAIAAARLLTPLSYEPADLLAAQRDGWQRAECRPKSGRGALAIEFQAEATAAAAEVRSLDAWLVERYRLFVQAYDGPLLAAEVEHPPWMLSSIRTRTLHQSLESGLGVPLGEVAAAHYSTGVAAQFGQFRVARAADTLPAACAMVGGAGLAGTSFARR